MTSIPDGRNPFGYAERRPWLTGLTRKADESDRTACRLRIGSIESAAAARLPSLLSSYHSNWPGIDIELAIGTSRSLVANVATGVLDCAFVAISDLDSISEMALRSISGSLGACHAYREEIMLLTPQTHPLIRDASSLIIDTMAVFPDGCTYRSTLEDWLGYSSARHRDWKVTEQVSYHAIVACVAAGRCFAACPRSVLNLRRAPANVNAFRISWVDTYLVYRHSHRGVALQALIESIRQKP